jgi:hypothetical protein
MRRWLLAAALPLLLLGFGLAHFGLLNNVEGMYAEIAREMLSRGDMHGWVIPTSTACPTSRSRRCSTGPSPPAWPSSAPTIGRCVWCR